VDRKSFLSALNIVTFCTLISRVLGMARSIAASAVFGLSMYWDAFVVAFVVPNLFRRLFGEGALNAAFIPVFTERLHQNGKEDAEELLRQVVTMLTIVLTCLMVIWWGGSYVLVTFFDFSDKTVLVFDLLDLMIPYMLFICLTAVLGGTLNVLGHFATPAIAPAIFNCFFISAIIAAAYYHGIYLVAIVVTFGGVIQYVMQLIALRRRGWLRYMYTLRFGHPAIRRLLLLMGPAAIGMGVFQINVVVDFIIAMYMVPQGGGGHLLHCFTVTILFNSHWVYLELHWPQSSFRCYRHSTPGVNLKNSAGPWSMQSDCPSSFQCLPL